MTCTPLTDPLRCLLNRLAGTTGLPTGSLNRVGLEEARRFGWVYEHQGRVALTGAGVYHAGGDRWRDPRWRDARWVSLVVGPFPAHVPTRTMMDGVGKETVVVDGTRKPTTRVRLFFMVLATLVVVAGCGSGDEAEPPFEVTSTVVWHETTQNISVWAPEADGSWPMVYMIHGVGGSGDDLAETATGLASQGVVVFAPNYRSTGSSEEMTRDLECGYRYARNIAADYGGDLDQPVSFVGDSYGAAIAISGGVAKAGGPGGSYDECFTGAPKPDVIVAIGGCYYEYDGEKVPWTPLDWMVNDIEKATLDPHLVLVVGEDDQVCQAWQSEDAAETLQAAGYDAEFVVIPGGDHGNVVFWTESDGEWVTVPDDPVGQLVVETILEAIDAAEA